MVLYCFGVVSDALVFEAGRVPEAEVLAGVAGFGPDGVGVAFAGIAVAGAAAVGEIVAGGTCLGPFAGAGFTLGFCGAGAVIVMGGAAGTYSEVLGIA